jgi:hypothetical protein
MNKMLSAGQQIDPRGKNTDALWGEIQRKLQYVQPRSDKQNRLIKVLETDAKLPDEQLKRLKRVTTGFRTDTSAEMTKHEASGYIDLLKRTMEAVQEPLPTNPVASPTSRTDRFNRFKAEPLRSLRRGLVSAMSFAAMDSGKLVRDRVGEDVYSRIITALHDPEAEAAVVSMAKMGRTDMDTITVDVKLDDDADRVRCIVEVTDKLRDLAQALMQTEIIHY